MIKIAIVSSPSVFKKIKSFFPSEDRISFSEPLEDFDEMIRFLKTGVTGIVAAEGSKLTEIVKTMSLPLLLYAGQKDFHLEIERWLSSLEVVVNEEVQSQDGPPKITSGQQKDDSLHSEDNLNQTDIFLKSIDCSKEDTTEIRLPNVKDTRKEATSSQKLFTGKKTILHGIRSSFSTSFINQMTKVTNLAKRDKEDEIDRNKNLESKEVCVQSINQESLSEINAIYLYSPESTGKTFVGINLAIALARMGKSVHYMDISNKVRNWFNSPTYPFTLSDIPLFVSGYQNQPFHSDAIVIIETREKKHIYNSVGKNILVVDSDLSHSIEVSKSIRGIKWTGMVWNMESTNGNPKSIISLPIITSLPRYSDVYENIEKGVPRAMNDDLLVNELLKIYNYDHIAALMGME
ncbi:hypothetical protein ABHN05_13235 [Brevibacillus laterosporus]|uniref:hypothetical protein n=1 Tax=Brevibacillus laterosporus TaxID=1465 RepID=UPI0011289322|nr:hypothetical protein [Brevibacillus laterosporus]MBG9804915.1 hypothetical protein [Brevibacillus laterosporus]MED4762076.1 hypothetical protein [Brevibacillus laterosporus]TPH09937.1 hypothetical protein EGH09_21515 [Brevibacillus laterosporus]